MYNDITLLYFFSQEFHGEDLSDLYLDEREASLKQAQEEKRRVQISVPGILNPYDMPEEMQDWLDLEPTEPWWLGLVGWRTCSFLQNRETTEELRIGAAVTTEFANFRRQWLHLVTL